ncbi:Antibiotic biosynthesis monooxygenase [Mycena kentingensis (nom. inval.)]|nr:Antibiotic biosynthesis monooxygenase [Mycena kentingensis (nom. inval.)]
MPASNVSLGLWVPLNAKGDKLADVTTFLKAGYDIVVETEPETIQWYGLKFSGSDTFAVFDTFSTEAGRGAHLTGKVAAALMANAPTLLASGPEILQPIILANKIVPTTKLTVGLRVFLTPKPDQVDAVREFLKGAVPLVEAEELTPAWYAIEFPGPEPTFGIIDFFEAEAGRDAHLGGKVAEALFANADKLLASAPDVVKVDVVAALVKA